MVLMVFGPHVPTSRFKSETTPMAMGRTGVMSCGRRKVSLNKGLEAIAGRVAAEKNIEVDNIKVGMVKRAG